MNYLATKQYVIVPDSGVSRGPAGPTGPQGPPGAAGSVTLPLSSDNVVYNALTLTQALDQLFYVPLVISSFTASPSTYEKGIVLTSIQLSWSYNKTVQAQAITGTGVVPPTLLLTDRSKVCTLSSLSSNFTIILTTDDVTGDSNPPKVSNINVQFLNKIYYGKAAIPGTIDSSFILSLQSNLQATRNISFNLSTIATEYIWFASPVAYGTPNFSANGFSGGFSLITTLSFTNASGWVESYYVYRSVNDNLGSTNIVIS